MFFGLIRKPKWLPWHLNGGGIFDLSAISERILTQLDRKQEHVLNVICQVCVFLTYLSTKMTVMTFDRLRYLRFPLCIHWTDVGETWLEASTQWLLLIFVFFSTDPSTKMTPDLWLADKFSTSQRTLNGFWRNLTGSKSQRDFLYQMCFRTDPSTTMAAMDFDWPRHKLLCNRWTDFGELDRKLRVF